MSAEREVEFDCMILKDLCGEKKNWNRAIDFLSQEFEVTRDSNGEPVRIKVPEKTIQCICEIYCKLELPKESRKELLEVDFLARALLRALRNSLIHPDTQVCMAKMEEFLHQLQNNIKIDYDSEIYQDQQRLLLTLLLNFMRSNAINAQLCHDLFYNDIKRLMEERPLVYESSAFMYNLYLNSKQVEINLDTCRLILKHQQEAEENEYFYFIISEFYLPNDEFWELYSKLEIEERITTLDVIKDNLDKDYKLVFAEKAYQRLEESFQHVGAIIMATAEEDVVVKQTNECVVLIDVMSALLADEHHRQNFARDKDRFILTHTLLHSIHKTGTSTKYSLAMRKLKNVTKPSKLIAKHPAFGLKVRLVKIVANMSWKNKEIQDLARRLDVIPLLLDCCHIDAKNPFIMEWIIFALRNLCDGNPENQQVIARLHQKGVVNSEELEEVGLTLHSDGEGKVKIVPLEKIRNKHD